MNKLVKVKQTCVAAPSQWDAWNENGEYFYMRYRHGLMRIHMPSLMGDEPLNELNYVKSIIESKRIGDNSYISLEDFVNNSETIELAENCEYIEMGPDEY